MNSGHMEGGGTYGSMLTGVGSLIADRTGGVMSQLSERQKEKIPSVASSRF